jgi:putative chitinase
MINRKIFFDEIRPLFGTLKTLQVSGLTAYLDFYENNTDLMPINQFAYVLATVFHETGQKMKPVVEIGKGIGKSYGVKDKVTGQIYYGRGGVQITWKDNYKRIGDLLHIDLVNNPDLALVESNSVKIAMFGMAFGWFTGRKLDHYITPIKCDYVGARVIINGTDRAVLIAGYADKFLWALEKAKTD